MHRFGFIIIIVIIIF
uniref:Uncharacterized protein n=1 Tax=Anguilla anguilla TaxID=7936 RepID=A0A0E9V6M8_ANGAN